MSKTKKKQASDLSVMGYFFKAMWRYKKNFYAFYVCYISAVIVRPLVNIFCPRYIIDEITSSRDINRIVMITAIMIAVNAVVVTAAVMLEEQLSKIYYEDLNRLLEADIGRKSMELKYEITESKKTLDYISNAKLGIQNAYSGGMSGLFKACSILTGNLAILAISVVVIGRYSWLLILLVMVSVLINARMNHKLNEISMAQYENLSFIDRGYYYLLHSLSDIRFGKDIRLFRAKEMMVDRVDNFNREQTQILRQQARQSERYVNISGVDMALTAILTYLVLAALAVRGDITIGEFTMLATAASALTTAMNLMLQQVLELKKFVSYAEKYIAFLENNVYEEKGSVSCEDLKEIELEFKGVSFRYPEQENFALKNINAVIKSGEHWSVVGLNGAGKTTFIKLLCRLYECTEGEILLNGVNILEYDMMQYTKLLAAVFQDFKLLNFSIKENITIEKPDRIRDEAILPLIEQVGLTEKVNSLPMGLETPVFRYYDMRGFEPSGGEQQKIAMARALYKDAPILILDEPTAALDPIAEQEVYEKFDEMTRGKTAVFISHRLSSCKFCDKILVFKDGEIVERGTHETLVKMESGLYAQMFAAQEKYYK